MSLIRFSPLATGLLLACSSGGGGGGFLDGGAGSGGTFAGGSSGAGASAGSSGSAGAGTGGASGMSTGGSSGVGGSAGGVGGSAGGVGGSGGSAFNIYCEESFDTCTCVNDPNNVLGPGIAECSSTTPGTARCCAPATYPTSGTCQCVGVGCWESASTCNCGTTNAGQPKTACQNAWPYCCAELTGGVITGCNCWNIPPSCNGPNQMLVSSCSIDMIGCTGNTTLVNSCKSP